MYSPDLPPLALIAGPTASGKSDLAVRLGQRLEAQGTRAVVLNADSSQVYADLRVLSARPREEEMGGIEHRLFGAWDGAAACSAADWAAAAKREIAALHEENAVPILCGGTGLYIRTLLEGIAPVPEIDAEIRAQVRGLSQGELSRDECIVSGQRVTRQYAKRQYTWFRHQPPDTWTRDDNKTIDEYDIFVSLLRRYD